MDYMNFKRKGNKVYHERGDATLKISEKDIISARYGWAINRLKEYGARSVLDIGCGLGFGTNLLHQAGFNAKGLDYSDSAINICKERYPQINFMRNSIFDLNGEQFEAITAFEIIEHFNEIDQNHLLLKCNNLLKNNSVLFLSTPNIKYSKNRNVHHLKELSYKEITSMFSGAIVTGLVLPHIRKLLSFIISKERLADVHLPIFRTPVSLAEYFFIEITKEVLEKSLDKFQLPELASHDGTKQKR
ncbi:MAG: hypothetical protein A2Y80_07920 [Deltaproteobacteria bacterium RBG_13_58_19]|nr:MAG: hypothetical protein A2Y80_07920 [Deltaproteobacteria bacterium RBG_13_58_19]